MTVKAVIIADRVYRVEGDSYAPVGAMHPVDSQTPVAVAVGSLLERYLRTIDLCNDSQLMQDENGHWQVTGGPRKAC